MLGKTGPFLCAVLALAGLAGAPAQAADLAAATLPSSRSAQIGKTVTVFTSVINLASKALSDCTVSLSGFPVALGYQITDASTNQPLGSPNTPFSLAVGATQTLVLSLTPTEALASTQLPLTFGCAGADPAAIVPGLNTVLLSASATQPPDIIALAATASNDGVLRMPGANQAGAFSVATINLGSDATVTVSANTGAAALPGVSLTVCETNPVWASCDATPAPSVTVDIPAGATPTFAFFVNSTTSLPFAPATNRAFVQFTDASNVVRGSTSVAITNSP